MGLTKKQLDEINKRALNKVARSNKKAIPQNNPTTNIADETLRRNTLQLNQQQVEPLPFGDNNPFSTNNMLASYQAFKQQPQFNEVQKFELRNNNSYKDLITRADNLRTQANDRLSQARNYVGVHKDLAGNDVQINNLKDYVSFLKNTNNPQGDNQEYINKLYKDEQDALRFADKSNREADEIERIAEAKIKSEVADNTASGSDLAFKRDRINSAISNMPYNSEERNDIARDYRKEFQDITNYKIQEDVWNNVPQDLRNNVQNAVTNNDTDTANKLLKNNGYDDNAIKSIINKAEINRDKNIAIKEENEAKEYARNNPVLASFKSIGNSLNPINNFEAVKELLGYRLGRAVRTSDEPTAETFNQYNEAQRKVNERATMQNEVANNIDNPILKSGYNIAMSTADNLGRMAEAAALDRILPGSGRFFNGLLASLDVASNEIRNGEERGLNTAQIASTALANAINEQLFETLSFDKIIKNADKPVADLKDFFKNLISKDTLVNMGIEGSEEAFTDLGNMVADKVLNGSQNELEQNYINLLNAGMSDEEAKKQVMLDKAQSISESFIAGAISGGLISAAVGGANYATDRAVNKINENKTLKNAGKNIIKAGNNQRVKNLVDNMQIEDEETQNIVKNTNWNDAQSVGRTVAQLIQYENNMVDNELKSALSIELSKKLAENNVNSAQQVANMIVAGNDVSGIGDSNVDTVARQYNDFMNGNITADNEYLNVSNDRIATHSNNLATLAELSIAKRQNINTENETTKEQKSLKTQNKASQGIIEKNGKSYVLDNPNQKFDILTLTVDKQGNTKVVAKGSHEYFNPDKVALDRQTAELVEVARDFSKEKKQAFYEAAEEGISNVADFAAAFNRAYETGKQGLGIATAFTDAKINLDLNNEQVEKAYQAGLDQYVLDAQNKTKNIQKAKNKYSGTVDTSNININNLDEAQKGALKVLNVLAEIVGVDFELFESKTDKEGRYVGENGSYNINNNKIRIDINAGLRVEGEKRNTMIVTLAHELAHSFEYNAPEAYAELQEFVFDKLTKQSGKTADELILEEALKLEAKDKENNVQTKSKDKYIEIAKSEIVARSCERLLTDEAAIKELAYTNQGLFGKIKAWIEQLCDNLKAAYRDLFDNEGNLKEGMVAEEANMLKDFENKLRTIWNNAAVEAGKNTEKVVSAKNATTKNTQAGKDKNVSTKKIDKTDKKSESSKNFEKQYEDVYKAINEIHAEYLKKNEAVAKRAGLETLDLLEHYTRVSPEEALNDTDFTVDSFKNIYKEIYNGLIKNEDAITGHEYEQIKEDKGENNLYSFAGRESATADLEMLKKAQQMAKEHKFKQDIFDQTGWFKGVDGKWRYEIDNSEVKLKENIINLENTKLSKVLIAPELFKAYPQLKNISFKIGVLEENTNGMYDESFNEITLNQKFAANKFIIDAEQEAFNSKEYKEYRKNIERLNLNNNELKELKSEIINAAEENNEEKLKKLLKEYNKIKKNIDKKEYDLTKELSKTKVFKKLEATRKKYKRVVNQFDNKDKALSTLLHEIQHVIQKIEDFERGSNLSYWDYVVNSNLMGLSPAENNLIYKREKEYRAFKNEIEKKYGNDIIILEFYNNDKNTYENALLNGLENVDELYERYEKSLKNLLIIGGEEAVKDAEKEAELWDLKEKYRNYAFNRSVQTIFDLYWNTVGEIEARDVQERLDNKSLFPKVGNHSIGMVSSGKVQDISDDQVLFQIRKDINNKPFVVVDGDILEGVKKSDYEKVAKKTLKDIFKTKVKVGNNIFTMNKNDRREFTHNKYMIFLFKNNKKMYIDKLKMSKNADEIIKAGKNWRNIEKTHESNNNNFIDFAYGDLNIRVGKNDYKAKVVIGMDNKGYLHLYDVNNLIPIKIKEPLTGATGYGSSISGVPSYKDSLPQSKNIATSNTKDDEILKQERDYNVEYNKELYKKYGFNIEILSDYDNDKEGVIRGLKRNKKIQKEFINNKVEPIYKNKSLEYHVLDKNEVKDYILNNNIDLETLKTNKAIRSNLYKIINNITDSQKIAFLKKRYVKEYNEIKNAIIGNVSDSKLSNDIKLINKPQRVIDYYAIAKKEEEYLKKNDNAFTKYVEKIAEKLLTNNNEVAEEERTPQEHIDILVDNFGTLEGKNKTWTRAGYITTDGQVLDFGNGNTNKRFTDHREIGEAFSNGNSYHAADNLLRFMSEGNIRVVAETYGLDLPYNVEPTAEQIELIEEYINDYANNELIIEFTNTDSSTGKTVDTKKYSGNVNADEVINDIDRFYRTGEIGGSKYSEFRYQERYNEALENENLEEVEKIVEDYAATKGYTQKVYHGTQQFGFTEIDLSKSDDRFSFWATDSLETASTYSGKENITPVKEAITIGKTPEDKIKAYKKVIENPDLDISYIKADEQLKKKYYLDINLKTIKKGLNRLDEYYKTKEKRTYFIENWEKTYNELVDLINKEIDTKTVDMELIKKLDNKLYSIGPYNVGVSDEYSMLPYLLNGTGTLIDAIQDKKSMYAESHGTYYSRKSEESMEWYINNSGLTFGNYEMLADLSGDFREVYAYGENWNNIEVNAKHKNYSSEEIIKMMKNEFDSIEDVKYDKKKNTFISKLKNGNEVIKTKEEMLDIFNLSDKYATELKRATTRDIVKEAKEQGYDGVIIRRVVDNGGRNYNLPYMIQPANIYIFFNPQQQLKSADPVTYDNEGNVIPLAERFDPDNVDIRFQERDNIDNGLSREQKDYIIDVLNGKSYNKTTDKQIYKMKKELDSEYFKKRQQLNATPKEIITVNLAELYAECRVINLTDYEVLEVHDYNEYDNKEISNENELRRNGTLDSSKYSEKRTGKRGRNNTSTRYGEQRGSSRTSNEISKTSSNDTETKSSVNRSEKDSVQNSKGQGNLEERLQERYSEKLYQKALAENEMYKKLVWQLERQLDLKPYKILTKTDAKRLASIIKHNTKTYMKIDELADMIIHAFQLEEAETASHQDSFWLRFRLNKVVNEAFDRVKLDSKDRTVYANQILGDLRKTRIKLSDEQKKEVAYYFGNYNNYRKHMMGKVIFSNNGSSIDHVWKELSGLYPDVFNENMNDTDMAIALDNIVTELQNMYVSDMGLNKKDATDFIVTELITEFTGMKPQKTLAAIRKEYSESAMKGRKTLQKELQIREKNYKKEIAKYKLKLQQAESRIKTQVRIDYRLSDEKEQLRNRIKKNARYLNTRFLRPRPGAYIPERFMQNIAIFLRAFEDNTKQFGNDELDALRIANVALSEIEDPDIKEEVVDEYITGLIDGLADSVYGRRLSQLTFKDLEDVDVLLQRVRKVIDDYVDNTTKAKVKVIDNYGKSLAGDLKQHSKYKELAFQEGFRNLVTLNNKTPYYFFKSIGNTADRLFRELRKGQDTAAKNIEKAKQFFEDTKAIYNYDKWDLDKTVKIGDIELNVEQAMALFATYKRQKFLSEKEGGEQDGKHTSIGGIILEDKLKQITKKNGEVKPSILFREAQQQSEKINDLQIGKVIDFLTEEQIKYVDAVVGYLSNDMSDLGNETSMKLNGYKKFRESYYFPYKSSSDMIMREESSRNDALPSLKNAGFTKALTKRANNALVISNFTDTAANHVNQMITYNALAVPQDTMNRVFSWKDRITEKNELGEEELVAYGDTIKTLMRSQLGAASLTYYQDFMRRINGGLSNDSASGLMNTALTFFKKNQVLANASVAIQQPSAIARAIPKIGAKYFLNIKWNDKLEKQKWNDIKKYSGVAIIKDIGGYDINTSWGISDYIANKKYKGIKKVQSKIDDTLGRLPAKMDELTWCKIWMACERKINAEQGLTGTKLKQATAELFDDVINATQVYDSMLTKSPNMASKDKLMKMASAFMSEPTVNLNMLFEAIRQRKLGNKSEAHKYLVGIISSIALNSLLVALVRGYRDKDKDKTYIERYLKNAAENFVHDINIINMIPVLKDILEVFNGYDVKRTDMEAIDSLVTGFQDGYKNFEEGELAQGIANFASGFGSITGVPVKNIIRDIEGIRSLVLDAINNNIIPKSSEDALEAIKTGVFDTEIKIQDRVDKFVKSNNPKDLQKIREEIELSIKKLHPEYSKDRLKKEVNSRLRTRITKAYKDTYVSGSKKEKAKIVERMKKLNIYKSTNLKDFGKDNSQKVADSWIIQDLKEQYLNADKKKRIEIRKKLYVTGHWKKLADLDKQLKKWQ